MGILWIIFFCKVATKFASLNQPAVSDAEWESYPLEPVEETEKAPMFGTSSQLGLVF